MIRQALIIIALLSSPGVRMLGQSTSSAPVANQSTVKSPATADDPSGTYTFLKDGEFVQLNIEAGKLSGYISRFGDADSDKGEFIDQFFEKASLDGQRVTFTTKVVHGVSYEFKGMVTLTPGRLPKQEGYRVLKGTLTQHAQDASGSEKTSQRAVEFKSFPPDMGPS
jgi:hypothetical protein